MEVWILLAGGLVFLVWRVRRSKKRPRRTTRTDVTAGLRVRRSTPPTITLVSAACPYCGVPQDPPPVRRRKCKDCGQVIHVRVDPQNKKHLVTAGDAMRYEREQRTAMQQASLTRMSAAGIQQVKVSTARDERVCARCAALDGKVFSIDDAPRMEEICENDYCRCVLNPVIPEVEG